MLSGVGMQSQNLPSKALLQKARIPLSEVTMRRGGDSSFVCIFSYSILIIGSVVLWGGGWQVLGGQGSQSLMWCIFQISHWWYSYYGFCLKCWQWRKHHKEWSGESAKKARIALPFHIHLSSVSLTWNRINSEGQSKVT